MDALPQLDAIITLAEGEHLDNDQHIILDFINGQPFFFINGTSPGFEW